MEAFIWLSIILYIEKSDFLSCLLPFLGDMVVGNLTPFQGIKDLLIDEFNFKIGSRALY